MRLVIQRYALFQAQRVADDFKITGRVFRDAEAHRVVCIGIDGAQGQDNRAFLVLENGVVGKQDIRRRVINLRKDKLVVFPRRIRLRGSRRPVSIVRRAVGGPGSPLAARRAGPRKPRARFLKAAGQQFVVAQTVRRFFRRRIIAAAVVRNAAFRTGGGRRARFTVVHV